MPPPACSLYVLLVQLAGHASASCARETKLRVPPLLRSDMRGYLAAARARQATRNAAHMRANLLANPRIFYQAYRKKHGTADGVCCPHLLGMNT